MPDIAVLSLFLTAAIALSLAPGPDNIFVLTQSAMAGRAAGLVVTLGLCTGLLVHTAAVAFGVAAVFATSALAFSVLKGVGAAYLLYLAWKAFRAGQAAIEGGEGEQASLWALYRRGIVMNITNPKVAIFFLAFLPQFAAPESGSLALQIMVLGALFIAATLCVFGAIAWGAGFLGEWLKRSPRAQVALNRVAALVFVGLAVKLVTAER